MTLGERVNRRLLSEPSSPVSGSRRSLQRSREPRVPAPRARPAPPARPMPSLSTGKNAIAAASADMVVARPVHAARAALSQSRGGHDGLL